MKANKSQNGTIKTTHEGYGNNRTRIDDKFLDFESLNDGIKKGIQRLHNKFNAFNVPVNQFVWNLYQNGYYTNSPANYEDVTNGIINGKSFKNVLSGLNISSPQKTNKPVDWNTLPQWQPPIQFKQQGGTFTGAGAGGSWDTTSDTFDGVSNFNEAFDNAVKKGLREFIFQGRRYNTKKENNPVREYNNRWVGQTRSADVKNPSKTYDRQAGPLRGPMSLIPMVTDTHVGSPERPPQLDYNPNAMEYFSSPFRSYQTAAPKRIRIKKALGGYHFKNKLTVKSN